MIARATRLGLLAITLLGPGHASGRTELPPPAPGHLLYGRIATLPETELTTAEWAAARTDAVAKTMVYHRCAKAALDGASACPWLAFDEHSESGTTVDGALQAIILGLRVGSLPSHADLFSQYGGSAALADMLVFDRPLHPDYDALIAAADGEEVLSRNFRNSGLNRFQQLVQGEPSSGLDAVLKYLFHDWVVRGNDVALIRLIELGPEAVSRFRAMHELGLLAGEPQHLPGQCRHPVAREYWAVARVLAVTRHPDLSAVQAESWPGLATDCRRDADRAVESDKVYGVQGVNRVSLAVSDNRAYRIRLHPLARSQPQ